jgi:hypothetical protein
MRVSTDALVSDIEPAMDWIGGLIGAAVDKRIGAFEKQERLNPLLAHHFRENFPLEFALAKARQYRRNTGRLPKGREYDPLYSFIIPTQRIHAALPDAAKSPFEGRLRDAVNGAHGARPLCSDRERTRTRGLGRSCTMSGGFRIVLGSFPAIEHAVVPHDADLPHTRSWREFCRRGERGGVVFRLRTAT